MPDGYALSAQAAAAERKWRTARLEAKAVGWSGVSAIARSDRDNFVTNRITTESFDDTAARYGQVAQALSAAGACVSFWSGNIAGLPLHVLKKGPGGVDVPAPEHPLYWLLHDAPSYDWDAFRFWEYMVEALEWHGNAYAIMRRRDGGTLTSLVPVDPTAVTARRIRGGEIEYRWVQGGREETVRQADMLHIRGRGGDALGGVSTLSKYAAAFGAVHVTESSSATMFRNGIRPSGTFNTDSATLTPEQRDDFEAKLQEKFVGAQNAGRPMLLAHGLKFNPLSMNMRDAEMIEARQLGMLIVCQIFEVDPHLVGITSGNTTLGSSITDQTLSLVKFKMHKRLKRIEGALEKQLLTRLDRQAGISVRFNLDGFLRADSVGRAQVNEIYLRNKVITINDVRAQDGKPPVPWGDRPWGQMQDAQMNERGEFPTGDPPPGAAG